MYIDEGTIPHKNRFIMHALHDIMRITTINMFISVFNAEKKVFCFKSSSVLLWTRENAQKSSCTRRIENGEIKKYKHLHTHTHRQKGTLILSVWPFFKFYFGNLYGIIIIILHPHLHKRFPWHFQSKWILLFVYWTSFKSFILPIWMFPFSFSLLLVFASLFLPLLFYSRKSFHKFKVFSKLILKFNCYIVFLCVCWNGI